jgi:hypothetical protein
VKRRRYDIDAGVAYLLACVLLAVVLLAFIYITY